MNLEKRSPQVYTTKQFLEQQAEIGQLIADKISLDQEYKTRIEMFTSIADAIKKSLPHPQEGYVRLWRGNRTGEVGSNPSYTTSLEGIALPFLSSYKGVLSYIDVPQNELPKYASSGAKNDDGSPAEYILPMHLVRQAHVVGFSSEEAQAIIAKSKPEEQKKGAGWEFV